MMRFKLSILALLLCGCSALMAQDAGDPLTASFSKADPVKLTYMYPFTSVGTWKKYLKKNSNFSDPQIDSIFKRILSEAGKPVGWSQYTYEQRLVESPKYQAYRLSEIPGKHQTFVLVWVPYDENMHMAENLRPSSKAGFLFYINKNDIVAGTANGSNGSSTAGKGGATGKDAGGVSSSTADMSSKIINGKIGVMIIYYGNKSTEEVKRAQAYTLYGNKQGFSGGLKNEKAVAEKLAKNGAYSEYIGYYFIKGGDCTEAENYVQRKFGLSKKELPYYIKCILEQYVDND